MILVVGELLIDMITTELVNNLSETKYLQIKAGGSAANFASFCSKLGASVRLISTVGMDGFGDIAIQAIRESGIATNLINRLAGTCTSVIIVSKSHSTPEFIPYRNADNNIEPVADEMITQCDIIHTTAFALSKRPAQTNIMEALEKAGKANKLISIDWNYAEKIWAPGNCDNELYDKVINYRPFLKVSMDDARRFWHIENDVNAAKEVLNKYKTNFICLTNGAEGVYYKRTDEDWEYKPSLPTNVIDVTGAGDAFWSGFITGYLQNESIEYAIDSALSVAKERLEQRI